MYSICDGQISEFFHMMDTGSEKGRFFCLFFIYLFIITRLEMAYTYKYPRPAVTVDIAVLKKDDDGYGILLIKRKNDPFAGRWALPGGFVDMDETVEVAASRELFEETNMLGINLKQFRVFSELDRDPRGRTISVVFIGFLTDQQEVIAKDDAKEVCWYNLNELPELAFDHGEIIEKISKTITN